MILLVIQLYLFFIKEFLIFILLKPVLYFLIIILKTTKNVLHYMWLYLLVFFQRLQEFYTYLTCWRFLPQNTSLKVLYITIDYYYTNFCNFIACFDFKTLKGWINFIDACFIFFLYHSIIFIPFLTFIYNSPVLKQLVFDLFNYYCLNYCDWNILKEVYFVYLHCPELFYYLGFKYWFPYYLKFYLSPFYIYGWVDYSYHILFCFFIFIYLLKITYFRYFIQYLLLKYWYKTVTVSWKLYLRRKILKNNFSVEVKNRLYNQKNLIPQLLLYFEYFLCLLKSKIIFLDYIVIFFKKLYVFIIGFVFHEKLKLIKISFKYWLRNILVLWRPLFKRTSYFGYYRTNRSKWYWYK